MIAGDPSFNYILNIQRKYTKHTLQMCSILGILVTKMKELDVTLVPTIQNALYLYAYNCVLVYLVSQMHHLTTVRTICPPRVCSRATRRQ